MLLLWNLPVCRRKFLQYFRGYTSTKVCSKWAPYAVLDPTFCFHASASAPLLAQVSSQQILTEIHTFRLSLSFQELPRIEMLIDSTLDTYCIILYLIFAVCSAPFHLHCLVSSMSSACLMLAPNASKFIGIYKCTHMLFYMWGATKGFCCDNVVKPDLSWWMLAYWLLFQHSCVMRLFAFPGVSLTRPKTFKDQRSCGRVWAASSWSVLRGRLSCQGTWQIMTAG